MNLRLFGWGLGGHPLKSVAADALPWTFVGMAVSITSGILLFLSEAMKCYASTPFQVKMTFLFLALVFHFTVHRKVTKSERDPGMLLGLFVGSVNALLWLGVGLGGRGIGFL